ncbi:hypothetical protein AB0I10_37295 [Streptomyces sp. NPDC050636]|uniref:hypothetical protein n=1 Tax=Streptomyces sp. NPDC050636 TaxID=3154510 RepID=UPI00341426C4
MSFAPCLGPFVIGFSDVGVFGLRDANTPDDRLQQLVNAHTYEDDHHWRICLDDLDTLGCNTSLDLVSALRMLWGDGLSSTPLLRSRRLRQRRSPQPVLAIADVGGGCRHPRERDHRDRQIRSLNWLAAQSDESYGKACPQGVIRSVMRGERR